MRKSKSYHRLVIAPARPSRPARVIAAVMLGCTTTAATAAEGGLSFYVPGLSVPGAGLLPPEGVYFDSTTWIYDARIGGNRRTILGGNLIANVSASIKADFVTGLWVTPADVFGGSLAFSVTQPFGEPTVRAGVVFDGPIIERLGGGPLVRRVTDSDFNPGDPVLTGILGWHSGNWHWKLAAAVSIPAGGYQDGQLSNVALNRYVGDVTGAVTYLDPALGLDLSVAAGFTVNGENPATRYDTGEEFHLDVGLTKYLTKELSVGAIASYYRQITGDSGRGARLGPFEGRDTAVGGTIGYTFEVGRIPVSTRLKVLREVEVERRFQGTITWISVSFPLWVAPPPAAEARPVVTRF